MFVIILRIDVNTFPFTYGRLVKINKIGFVSPARRNEAPVCCTTVENVI